MKGWKKWMAVGCSHGDQIDPDARKAVLVFKERWKPDMTIHLGDFLDLAAFRSGVTVAEPLVMPVVIVDEPRMNCVWLGIAVTK